MQYLQSIDPQELKYFIGHGRSTVSNQDQAAVKPAASEIKEKAVQNVDVEVDVDKLVEELKKYNNQLDYFDKEIRLSINEKIDRLIVTVVNKSTNEVIYEYPYEELQKLAEHIKDITGIMLDTKV